MLADKLEQMLVQQYPVDGKHRVIEQNRDDWVPQKSLILGYLFLWPIYLLDFCPKFHYHHVKSSHQLRIMASTVEDHFVIPFLQVQLLQVIFNLMYLVSLGSCWVHVSPCLFLPQNQGFYCVLSTLSWEIIFTICFHLLTLCWGCNGPLTFLFWRFLKARKLRADTLHVGHVWGLTDRNCCCFFRTGRIIWTSSHLFIMQWARWRHQGCYRLPEPPLHWSLVQLMDICHSPTTADPATVRAVMKYVWNKDV